VVVTDTIAPVRTARLRLSGGQLFWRETGHGAPVVFLHGTWEDGNQWDATMRSLAPHAHCFAPDLLGCGESLAPLTECGSITQQVTALREYVQALRLRQPILVGHSLGAWVAARYWAEHPDGVRGVVLVAPEGLPVPPPFHRDRRRLQLLSRSPLLRRSLTLLRPWAQRPDSRLKSALEWRSRLRRYPTATQLLLRRRSLLIEADWVAPGGTPAAIAPPLLLLRGTEDSPATTALAQSYADCFADLRQAWIEGDSATLSADQGRLLGDRLRDCLATWPQ
jgi:haloalkane dehalogenase